MESLAKKYPKYYKAVPPGVSAEEVDTYAINLMFPVDDPSGTILHARKKLLIPGVRSGGKSMLKDVIEARDTLNRYIALHQEASDPIESAKEEIAQVSGGWLAHTLNDCPVNPNDLVQVRLDNGHVVVEPKEAGQWNWNNTALQNGGNRYIDAWRFA